MENFKQYGPTKNHPGGSRIGYITLSYAELVQLFGEPGFDDGYKVSSEWAIVGPRVYCTIYDYKETNLYDDDLPSVDEFRALPSYEWHIGGSCDIPRFARWISEQLGREVAWRK